MAADDQASQYREVIGGGTTGVYRVRHGLGTSHVIIESYVNAPPYGLCFDLDLILTILDADTVELDFNRVIPPASILVVIRD